MTTPDKQLWQGLAEEARTALLLRDYGRQSFSQQLAGVGIGAGQLVSADRTSAEVHEAWIPGVEIFPRTIYPQRHRGSFGELVRRDEGLLARIGFWPAQWASARMFAQTAKGFHVHPPSIPGGFKPADWLRRCFVDEPENFSLRHYDLEQWDVLFFVQGVAEIILRDARAGLPARTMRFFVDGDNHRGMNNVGVVVPPGVAHAVRVEGSEELIMVYGTSTSFKPEYEGRIASEVETAVLPESWQRFLG
jgi:dTDP-4-dehydrorhamnose 3,5-epimerase-like enzyme